MMLRIRACAVAPDVRFGAARALGEPASKMVVGGVELRAEGRLPLAPGIPAYLRYSDRDAVLVADGIEHPSELESCLTGQVQTLAESGGLDDLSVAVIALDAVDHCFRASGLWRGNIYLAGAGALTIVLSLAGEGDAAHRGPDVVIRELAALELAYLFPIAGKFRSGGYDGQVQYRLNGWGRALAGRLSAGSAGAARAAGYQARLEEHLARERQRYCSLLDRLDVARQDYQGNRLDEALKLPIPVLV